MDNPVRLLRGRGSIRDHFQRCLKDYLLQRAERFLAEGTFGGDPAALAAFAEEVLWSTTEERRFDDSPAAKFGALLQRTKSRRGRLRHIRMLLRRLNNPKLQSPDQVAYSLKEIARAKKDFPV